MEKPSSEKANHFLKAAEAEWLSLSPYTSHSRSQICQPETHTVPKTASNNGKNFPTSAPHRSPPRARPESSKLSSRLAKSMLTRPASLRPQNSWKLASVSMASKNQGKTRRPETVDWWWRVTWARGSHRDRGSRGLDSTLTHWISFQIARKIKKTGLGIEK